MVMIIILFACWVIFHACVAICWLFLSYPFQKFFQNIIRVSNSFDPDQDRQNVGPNLCPSCLQRLPADDKSGHLQGKKS